MGSEYRVLIPTESGPRPDSIVLLIEGIQRIEIGVTIGQLEFSESEHRLRVVPKSNPTSIQTHRWCYEIRLASRSTDGMLVYIGSMRR